MAEEKPLGDQDIASEEQPSAIVRDPTFVRLVADMAVLIERGTEFEISLLAHGPDPISYVHQGGAARFEMAGSYNEVGRLRIDLGPAMNLAMNIIESNIRSGRVNPAALRSALEVLLALGAEEVDQEADADDTERE